MERVRSDISPESVQSDMRTGCSCTSHFEEPRSDFQASISCHNLHRRNPFSGFTSLTRRNIALCRSRLIYRCNDETCFVGESLSGSKMCFEIPIPFKDVELICCFFLVVSSERPSTGAIYSIFRREVNCAKGDAQVEVREDKLDSLPISID